MPVDLIAKLPELEREAQEHEQKARALRQIIEGVRTLNGDATRLFGLSEADLRVNQYAPEEGPRGREAVRQITRERPGIWRVRDIKRENAHRGWPSSSTAIETACKRLAEDGAAEWISRGVYRFGPVEPIEPHETGADTSEGVRTGLGPAPAGELSQ